MRLLAALCRQPLDRPPIWFMRQAGRYLPEYRQLRAQYSFEEAVQDAAVATEITLQPLRRFPLDAAIVFADIMTPLSAMGVDIEFAPGPKLKPHDVDEVARLGRLDIGGVDSVTRTIANVRAELDPSRAVIGFAGGPVTLLAYLIEGGGSQHHTEFRAALHGRSVDDALHVLAEAMRVYLAGMIAAGADVVQLFDSWAGLLSVDQFQRLAVPAARHVLAGLTVPSIYFAPGAPHLLESFRSVGATGYGVDWRLGVAESWRRVGEDLPLQGNLDPAALLAGPDAARAASVSVLTEAAGRPGHVFNLGHGIFPGTAVESVEAMVETVVGWRAPS